MVAFFIEFFAFVLRIVPIPNLSNPETGADSLAIALSLFPTKTGADFKRKTTVKGRKTFSNDATLKNLLR